jgi:hypothetical protein
MSAKYIIIPANIYRPQKTAFLGRRHGGVLVELIRTDGSTVKSIFGLTASVLEKHGTRAPGSLGAKYAADELSENMEQFCDTVRRERFTMHPGALFSMGRIVGCIYMLSLIMLILGGVFCYISAAICITAFVYTFVHFFLYGRLFDPLFAKKAGCNVVGTVQPSGEVKKQVIISGHHDSAYVFSFFSKLEKLAGIRLILAIAFFVFITAAGVACSVRAAAAGTFESLRGADLIISLAGLLFIVPAMFFISTKASPGAGDNLNGSSIAIHTGRFFAQNHTLQNTRIIILSTDGEEAGQRGSIDYSLRHLDELRRMPTYVINIDSIYKKNELAVMLRDIHGLVPLSKPLAGTCLDAASRLGYSLKRIRVPFGSGTDAAPFSRLGIEATSIIAMPTSIFKQGHAYHTLNDTIDNIEPEAVSAVLDITVNAVLAIDGE